MLPREGPDNFEPENWDEDARRGGGGGGSGDCSTNTPGRGEEGAERGSTTSFGSTSEPLPESLSLPSSFSTRAGRRVERTFFLDFGAALEAAALGRTEGRALVFLDEGSPTGASRSLEDEDED